MHVAMLGYGSSFWDTFPDPRSGREVQVWGIATELARRGHEVTLLKGGGSESMTAAGGVDIVSVRGGRPGGTFQGFQDGSMIGDALSFSRRARSVLEDLRPDVLCLHYGLSSRFLGDLQVPRSFTFHVADVMATARRVVLQRDFVHYPQLQFSSLMERASADRADGLVVLNRQMRGYLQQVWKRSAQVIPCGVDQAMFRDLGDDGRVLYAGRLDWNKNVELLVRAFAALPTAVRREHPLRLVGSGDCEATLRRRVRQEGLEDRVEFIPWATRSEVASIMGSCSVLVLPSIMETFGIVLIEAMACGKPILATDIPGPRDIIAPGENGLLARSGDAMDLVRQVALPAAGPRAQDPHGLEGGGGGGGGAPMSKPSMPSARSAGDTRNCYGAWCGRPLGLRRHPPPATPRPPPRGDLGRLLQVDLDVGVPEHFQRLLQVNLLHQDVIGGERGDGEKADVLVSQKLGDVGQEAYEVERQLGVEGDDTERPLLLQDLKTAVQLRDHGNLRAVGHHREDLVADRRDPRHPRDRVTPSFGPMPGSPYPS